MERIAWTESAKADVRALDKPNAMRVPHALHRFAETGSGDVKKLQGNREEFRLRIGDHRLFFVYTQDEAIEVRHVQHRGEAYR